MESFEPFEEAMYMLSSIFVSLFCDCVELGVEVFDEVNDLLDRKVGSLRIGEKGMSCLEFKSVCHSG